MNGLYRLNAPAEVGLSFACQQGPVQSALAYQQVGARNAVVGFTSPSTTYTRMRSLQADAARLDQNVQSFVPRNAPFFDVWSAWYRQSWLPFYTEYASEDYSTSARLGALWKSDAIADQTTTSEAQFNALAEDYAKQRQANGQPVPTLTFAPHTADQAKGVGVSSLPWWFWAGAATVVVGIGYLAYAKYQEAQRTAAVLKDPEVLSSLFGPEAGAAMRIRNRIDARK